MEKNFDWFLERIGIRIYPSGYPCQCDSCKKYHENGFVMRDEMEADYIYSERSELAAEGVKVEYFDSKQERDKYEKASRND